MPNIPKTIETLRNTDNIPLSEKIKGGVLRGLEILGITTPHIATPINPELEEIDEASREIRECIREFNRMKEVFSHIHEDLSRFATPRFSDLSEGVEYWVAHHLEKDLPEVFPLHITELFSVWENIKTLSGYFRTSEIVSQAGPEIGRVLQTIGNIPDHVSGTAKKPWAAHKDLQIAIEGMLTKQREKCSDAMLAEYETVERGEKKKKKEKREKDEKNEAENPKKISIAVNSRRELMKQDTAKLLEWYFPRSIENLIVVCQWICLAIKPKTPNPNSLSSVLDRCIVLLEEEIVNLEWEKQRATLPFVIGTEKSLEKARAIFDGLKREHETAVAQEIFHMDELNTAQKTLEKAEKEVSTLSEEYRRLSVGKSKKSEIPEPENVDFDIDSLFEMTAKDSDKELPSALIIDHEAVAQAFEVLQTANTHRDEALAWKNETEEMVATAWEKIRQLEEARRRAEGILAKRKDIGLNAPLIMKEIQGANDKFRKSTNRKRIYLLIGVAATSVAFILGEQTYNSRGKTRRTIHEESKPKLAGAPIIETSSPPNLEPKEEKIERIHPETPEKLVTKEKLDTEIMMILFSAGYDEDDKDLANISHVIADVLGPDLFSTPSPEKRKKIVESVLRTNFGLQSIQARKELRDYFSGEMRNGSLAINFTPTVYREVFEEIEKHGWSKLSSAQKLDVLEKVLYREYYENIKLPQKSKEQAIEEIILRMQALPEESVARSNVHKNR